MSQSSMFALITRGDRSLYVKSQHGYKHLTFLYIFPIDKWSIFSTTKFRKWTSANN